MIKIKKKNVVNRIEGFKEILERKTGESVPLTKAVETAFENDILYNSFINSKVKKKKKRKKQYEFTVRL